MFFKKDPVDILYLLMIPRLPTNLNLIINFNFKNLGKNKIHEIKEKQIIRRYKKIR